jgi:hypothetical protein
MTALLLAAPCRAAEPPPAFAVRTADGKVMEGPLQVLTADWSVRVGAGDGERLAGADVLTVRRVGGPLPPLPARDQVLLTNGDRIPITMKSARLVGERLRFQSPCLNDGKEVGVPLSSVAVLWFAETSSENPERLRRRLTTESRKRDVVLLRNGDALEGDLTGLDDLAVRLEVAKKPVTVELARTAAVALSTDFNNTPRPKGAYGRVTLEWPDGPDGARLTLASATCADGAVLKGTTAFDAPFSAPLARVAALDLYQGRATYLSELKPLRYEFLPYLDDRWDYSRDGSTTGLDLLMGGSAYDRGVGLHSHGRLTFAVPKDARRFEATVGLDDRAGPRASARVRVLADGKALDLGGDGELTAGGAPLAVGVDVAGVKELTLEVDYGRGGPVQGHVDWVDARFIK